MRLQKEKAEKAKGVLRLDMKKTVTAGEAKKNANTSTMVLNDQKAKELLESVENTQTRIEAALNLLRDTLEESIKNVQVVKEESKNNGTRCFKTVYLTLDPEEVEETEEELYGDEDEYVLDVLHSEYTESVEDLAASMENYKQHLENALVAVKHGCEQIGGEPTSAYMKHLSKLTNEVDDAFIRLRNQYNVTEYTRQQLEEYEAENTEGTCL